MLKKMLLLCAAVCVFLPTIASAAQVAFFLGDVTLLRNGKKTPVAVGNKLQSGDVVKTGRDSVMEIKDLNGNKIKILAMSTATIGSKKIAGSETVSLIAGNLSGMFTKLKKGSTKVYSPTTIAAVRGTKLTMSVSSSGDTLVDLSSGVVEVSNPYGSATIRENQKTETLLGEGPRAASGPAEEWKEKSEQSFAQDPDAKSRDAEKYLETLSERGTNTSKSMTAVQSSIKNAENKESLEKAVSLLNNTEEITMDDLILNESLGQSFKNSMERFQNKSEAISSKYRSMYYKSNRVAAQQQRNLESLRKIREEYKKAYQKIKGTYKNKVDEIKSKFKEKKSDI